MEKENWVLNLKHVFLAGRVGGMVLKPLYPSMACGLCRAVCWECWAVHMGETPSLGRASPTSDAPWMQAEQWSWRRTDEILFGKHTSTSLGLSWREERMPLSLSWRQEGRTSVDTGSRDKSGDAFSRTAALPGRKDCLEEMWDLYAPSWGQPAPLQKSFSLWAGSKLLAQYFSYCDPRKHSPQIHPEKPWVGLQLLLDTAGWRLNSLLSFQLRCCPWILCFSTWVGFQQNPREQLCPWVTAHQEQRHDAMPASIISLFPTSCWSSQQN